MRYAPTVLRLKIDVKTMGYLLAFLFLADGWAAADFGFSCLAGCGAGAAGGAAFLVVSVGAAGLRLSTASSFRFPCSSNIPKVVRTTVNSVRRLMALQVSCCSGFKRLMKASVRVSPAWRNGYISANFLVMTLG